MAREQTPMESTVFFALPLLVAAGSATLSYYMMRCRMEVAVSRERETLADVQARLDSMQAGLPDKLRAARESARLEALDSVLGDIRVEERRFIRGESRPAVVLQERLFFRNVPLSNWVEHEIPLRDGMNLALFEGASVFCPNALTDTAAKTTGSPRLLTH